MPRARRLLLLIPLLVLTAFFAACGWRNWHLQKDERGAWLEGTGWAMAQMPGQKVWNGDLDVSGKDEPEIYRVMAQNYPGATARFVSGTPNFDLISVPQISVGAPNIINQFRADNQITFSSPGGGDKYVDIVLTRSPIKFWDNGWHITRASNHR